MAQGRQGSSHTDCSVILCVPEKNLSSGVAHVSFLVVSPAVSHEHIIFLVHSHRFFLGPKSLRLSLMIQAYSGDPYRFYGVHEKVGEENHRAPTTEEVEEFGEIGTAGLPDSQTNQRRPTSNRRCISTIPWKTLQTLNSKMESYKRCGLHHCMSTKLLGDPMQWSCMMRGKCKIHSSRPKGKFEVSFI